MIESGLHVYAPLHGPIVLVRREGERSGRERELETTFFEKFERVVSGESGVETIGADFVIDARS